MIGKRFHRLTVIGKGDNRSRRKRRTYLSCKCDCGHIVNVRDDHLKSGRIASCGCWKQERLKAAVTHGQYMNRKPTGAYKSWEDMKQRCLNPNNPGWPHYGGRGIRVHERWKRFECFFADMGKRPPGYTLERIDNDGDYEPGNCKWVPRPKQQHNKRTSVRLTFKGRTQCAAEWASEIGIKKSALYARIARGWTAEAALTLPVLPNARQQRQRPHL